MKTTCAHHVGGVARLLREGEISEAEYEESVKSVSEVEMASDSERVRDVLSRFRWSGEDEGDLGGTSPILLAHLRNSGLIEELGGIATRQAIEDALISDPEIFEGKRIVVGVALVAAGNSDHPHVQNDLSAKNLAEGLEEEGIELGEGKIIQIAALDCRTLSPEEAREDRGFGGYRVALRLNPEATEGTIREAVRDLSEDEWKHTGAKGLYVACLNEDGYWDCTEACLAVSFPAGRVALVSGEAQ